MFGEGGLIKRAEQSGDVAKEASAKEKLTLKLSEYMLDIQINNIREADAKDAHLCTKLSELGPTNVATDPKYYEVEVDGWLFWVNRETLEIVSQGKAEPIYPEKIEVTNKNIEVYIGEGKAIELKLTPQNASKRFIKYTSSNEEIATASNGIVTGIKEGTAEITIESTENDRIKDTCTVTVKKIELTGISLNKTETTIVAGKTETLTITYTPSNATYKDIKWTTGDSTIAMVDETTGVITGLKAGETTIIATSVQYPSVKAECKVTIEEIIEISTIKELEDFRDSVNQGNKYVGKKVTLMNDLDLNEGKYTISEDGNIEFAEDAINWTAIESFSGIFDGKNHKISGLYIESDNATTRGLFNELKTGGIIQNLGIEKSYINSTKQNDMGGHAGSICADNYGTIRRCYNTATIIGTAYVGGIVGQNCGTITECYNAGNIEGIGHGGSSGSAAYNYTYVGGINGENLGIITNCYNSGKIKGKYKGTGGIIGSTEQNSTINNCYNIGKVIGTSAVGGIGGYSYQTAITKCFNTGEIEGNTNVGGVIGDGYKGEAKSCCNIGNIVCKSTKGAILGASAWLSATDCYYLKSEGLYGIGGNLDSECTKCDTIDEIPNILSVINGDNTFVVDDGRNKGYPILEWQKANK